MVLLARNKSGICADSARSRSCPRANAAAITDLLIVDQFAGSGHQQIANPTALALISALHFGQNFSPPGPFAASGGHCEPTATDSNTTGSNMEGYRYRIDRHQRQGGVRADPAGRPSIIGGRPARRAGASRWGWSELLSKLEVAAPASPRRRKADLEVLGGVPLSRWGQFPEYDALSEYLRARRRRRSAAMEPERPTGPGSSAARRAWQAQGHTSVGAGYAVIITRHPTDSEQPVDVFDGGDQDAHTAPEPLPPDPAPPSTAVLRSVGGPQRVQLPTQRHRNRHLALRPGRQHGTMTTTMWRTLRLLPPAHLWTVVNIRVDPVLRRAGGRGP